MATKKKLETFLEGLSTAEDKARNFASFNYIKTLAATTITDISAWDVLKVFGGEDGHLVTDKKQLNKLFFDNLEKVKEKTKKKIQELEKLKLSLETKDEAEKALVEEASVKDKSLAQLDLISTHLVTTVATIRSQEERMAEDNFHHATRNLESAYRNVENQHKNVGDAQMKYLSMKKDPKEIAETIKKQLHNIVTKGVWINPIFQGNFLYLNTPTNIVLNHVNKAASVDMSLDVGQVAVKINMTQGFAMTVIPYKDNIIFTKKDNFGYGFREFFHPHVNVNGQICWGNASDTYVKMVKNFELDKSLILLHALLNSYSETAPYVLLSDLKSYNKKLTDFTSYGVTNGSAMIHPENVAKKTQAQIDAEAEAARNNAMRFALTVGAPPYPRPRVDESNF